MRCLWRWKILSEDNFGCPLCLQENHAEIRSNISKHPPWKQNKTYLEATKIIKVRRLATEGVLKVKAKTTITNEKSKHTIQKTPEL